VRRQQRAVRSATRTGGRKRRRPGEDARVLQLRLPLALVLSAAVVAGTAAPAAAADVPPAQPMQVGTALPPGNSGHFSLEGEARGRATGDPGQYGPHIDDQREMFWDGEYKDGRFADVSGQTPQTPKDGVRIYEDDKGVPVVYGDTGFDVWFGAGYAAGQQRLFLADAVRRLGRGTYAELVGPSGVPVDVQQRTLTYSQEEYDAIFQALPALTKEAFSGYAAGIDAWIRHVRANPKDLPAEYVLLSTLPAPWTVTDSLAAGVLITRTVASAGGDEFREIETLRALGGLDGLGAYTDLRWQSDEKATVTVPPGEGRFDNAVVPSDERDEVLRRSAQYALSLPRELAAGPGTGAHPRPAVPDGAGLPPLVQSSLARAAESLVAYGKGLHGGSYAFAVAPKRTSTGAAMLVSGPQLGYTYPTQLWEIEVHGGGYDARGSTVPGNPTVGIGYGKRVAWGLTTGNSKTVDSFIETTRRTDGKLEYLHQGVWKPADCRTETIRYRTAVQGVPTGPAALTEDVEVCRTVHGPVVATTADGTMARSVQYAMFGREQDNGTGILQWNRADDLAEFEQGMRTVTWNENTVYADADGRIAYWHPGLFPKRSPGWDSRFPAPGTGEHDTRGFVPFEQMPQSVDPAVGYLANWNGKPAVGWIDEYLEPASSRPGGKAQRVQVIHDLLAAQARLTPQALRDTEYRLGNLDQRVPEFAPLLTSVRGRTPEQRAAIALLKAWDGTTYGPGAGTSAGAYTDATVTDGPAKTLWMRYMDDLRDEVLGALPAEVVKQSDAVASHVYDASPADNLVLRVLAPSRSSLTPSRNYLNGRTPADAMLAALDRSIAALSEQYGSDPATWRMQHERRPITSLTGVIGPSLTMPYMDRGSWVHVVAFTAPAPSRPVAAPPGRPRPAAGALPATGPAALLPVAGLALLGAAALTRRRNGSTAASAPRHRSPSRPACARTAPSGSGRP
jgi:penicillin amidase